MTVINKRLQKMKELLADEERCKPSYHADKEKVARIVDNLPRY